MELSAVLKFFGGVRATVFAFLAALLFVACAVQTYRLWLANSKAEVLEMRTTVQKSALDELRREATAQKARANAAVEAFTKEKQRRDTAVVKTLTKLERVYVSEPQIADWASTPVPASVADQLR